ncbi:MAG: hypothetical protein U1E17_02950 [Geminicoccaceae bacterium]
MTALPGLSLRAAEVGDAAACARSPTCSATATGITLRLPYQSLAQTRRLLEALSEADIFLAAELDGQLVASGSLHRQGGRRHHAAATGIGVHDAWTGRYIGNEPCWQPSSRPPTTGWACAGSSSRSMPTMPARSPSTSASASRGKA